MRLPEAKIREAIVHPDNLAAINTYRRGAVPHVPFLAPLTLSPNRLDWAIRALHRTEDQAEDQDRFFPALSQVLCSADPQLLVSRAENVLQAPQAS